MSAERTLYRWRITWIDKTIEEVVAHSLAIRGGSAFSYEATPVSYVLWRGDYPILAVNGSQVIAIRQMGVEPQEVVQ